MAAMVLLRMRGREQSSSAKDIEQVGSRPWVHGGLLRRGHAGAPDSHRRATRPRPMPGTTSWTQTGSKTCSRPSGRRVSCPGSVVNACIQSVSPTRTSLVSLLFDSL